jgi:protein-S-isoprenylcysteine O-methyltransferase Ste14
VISSGSGLWFLLVGYFLLALFVMIERSLRKTANSKTLQRGNNDRGSTLLIGSAFGAGLLLPLVINIVGVGLFPIDPVEGLLALAVMMIGIGLRVWAAKTLGRYYTRTLLTTTEQRVVKVGPYTRIRHPGYLGDILLWSAFGVLSSNLIIVFLFQVMFAAVYLYRIRVEERMLVQELGDEYIQYRRGTYKLVPFVY